MKNVHISQVFDLWQSYKEIKFRFSTGQRVSKPDYCIVTACNPRSLLLSEKYNRLRIEKLQRYLNAKDVSYRAVVCGSLDFSWQEPSFAVSMPVGQCISLARLYEQNAIYQVKNGELWLVPVLLHGIEKVKLGQMADFIVDGH